MLRITINEGPTEQLWILQGSLVAPWVAELETSWKNSRSSHEARKRVVVLSEVTRIDDRGEKVLREMKNAGVELIACGVYMKHVVEEISNRCKHRGRQ
jgi:hypothetical protein